MKCEICGKEIDWGSVITTEGYELDASDRHWYHKSCYDKSIKKEILKTISTFPRSNDQEDELLLCLYRTVSGEVSPQEAKPSEERLYNCGCSCHKGTVECTWCREHICSFGVKQSEPPAESTEVEEIEELEKTDGYLITNGLVDKVQELVRVVNRLTKEIKLKREKDGL